ncbi:MAG TPA: hypothetical protein PKA20_25550 [Burkholderiaceae bacterium]|nr:hypothetical protein [Burkholderiaceae bacterium]
MRRRSAAGERLACLRMARSALIAGAVGRLGEAVLNRALAGDQYERVVALAHAPMNLGVRRLALASADDLPPLDDLFLVLSDPGEPAARSFYGRDAAFTLLSADLLQPVAQRAIAAGARRALLLSPLPAWQQMSRFHQGLSGDRETGLAALPFESLTILRPVKAAATAGGSLVERITQLYLSVQMTMLPKSIPTLTSEQLARAAVSVMAEATTGIRILDAAALDKRLREEGG